jgi:tetratricopeptide (TPR) repeat protein
MYDTNRYETAQVYFQQAIERRDGLAHAHARLGDLALRTDDFATAVMAFERAHELAPSHPDYLTNLASALIYAEKYDRAVDRCQELFRLDTEKLSPYVECALASRLHGDFAQSLAILKHALDYFNNDEVVALHKNDVDWFSSWTATGITSRAPKTSAATPTTRFGRARSSRTIWLPRASWRPPRPARGHAPPRRSSS